MMASAVPQEIARQRAIPQWKDFNPGFWQSEINVRDFIQQNYEPYEGDESFLAGPTSRTTKLWDKLNLLFVEERRKGVLDISPIPSRVANRGATQASDHAERRLPDDCQRAEELWLRTRA
jgi:formate C-acetyltransferase